MDTNMHIGRTSCEEWSSVTTAKEHPAAGREAWNLYFPRGFRESTALLTP